MTSILEELKKGNIQVLATIKDENIKCFLYNRKVILNDKILWF